MYKAGPTELQASFTLGSIEASSFGEYLSTCYTLG